MQARSSSSSYGQRIVSCRSPPPVNDVLVDRDEGENWFWPAEEDGECRLWFMWCGR